MSELTVSPVCGIYGLKCKTTGKWYVGQSVDILARWKNYKTLRCRGQVKIYNAILKYGYDDFDTIVLEEVAPIDWILNYREMFWIKKLNSVSDGYNLQFGGNGGRHSKESKNKISAARIGMKFSMETRLKLSVAKFGKKREYKKRNRPINPITGAKRPPFSDEHRRKLSIAKIGKRLPPFTEEHRRKISEAATKRAMEKKLRASLITN